MFFHNLQKENTKHTVGVLSLHVHFSACYNNWYFILCVHVSFKKSRLNRNKYAINSTKAIRMFICIDVFFSLCKIFRVLSHGWIALAPIFSDRHSPNSFAMDCNLQNHNSIRNNFRDFHSYCCHFHSCCSMGMLFHSSRLNRHSYLQTNPDNYFDTANCSYYNKYSVDWILNFQYLHNCYHTRNNMDNIANSQLNWAQEFGLQAPSMKTEWK